MRELSIRMLGHRESKYCTLDNRSGSLQGLSTSFHANNGDALDDASADGRQTK